LTGYFVYGSGMPVITPIDEEVAERASKLLVEWGSTLSVSATQVIRWRSARVFELPPGPRQGRGHLRQYPDNAGYVAARFRLVVERTDSLDEALLVAMTEGLDVSHAGISDSFGRIVLKVLPRLRQARSPKKRSQRFTLPAPHEPDEVIARDAILDFTTDIGPSHPIQTEALIHRLSGSDTVEYLRQTGGVSRIHGALQNLAFVSLRNKVRDSSREDLRWAAELSRTVLEYAHVLSEFSELTGSERQSPLHRAISQVGTKLRQVRVSYDLGLAFLTPAILIFISNRSDRRQLDDVAKSCRREIPRLKAMTEIAAELPEHWRPCIGAGGLAAFARLPEEEADELLARVRQWLDAHPEVTTEITIKDPETRAAELAQMTSTDEVT